MAPIFTGFRFGFGGGAADPSGPFSATGGTILTPGNGYTYHVFSTPGTFTVSGSPSKIGEWLLIGGGASGGAGDHYGGGGGAGGVVYKSSQIFTPGSYSAYIGSAGPTTPGQTGSPAFPTHNLVNVGSFGGEDSEFTIDGSTIYALGGGSGANRGQPPGSPVGYDGGSAGGGGVGWPSGPWPVGSPGTSQQSSQNPGIPNLNQYGNSGTASGPGPATWGGNGGSANPSNRSSFTMSLTPNPSSVLISGSPIAPYTFAIGGVGYNNPSGSPTTAPATSYGSGGGGGLNLTPLRGGSPGVLIIMYPE